MLTLTTDDKTNVYFSSLPGQGVIYNVIVWDPLWNTSAAYIPVHTYACSFADLVDNCFSLSKLGLVCPCQFISSLLDSNVLSWSLIFFYFYMSKGAIRSTLDICCYFRKSASWLRRNSRMIE